MHRDLCSSNRLILESWGQQTCNPFVHLLGQNWIGMHRQPDILPIAPNMIGQTYSHGGGAWCAPLAQALMRHDKVVEADHEPDLPPVARAAPGQTAGAAPQGGDEPTQGAIPAFHKGGLDRRAELAQAQLLAKTAWATADHAPADLHNMASRVADLDHLGVKQGRRRYQPGLRLAPYFPTPPPPIHDPHNLQQRRRIGLPPIREKEWESLCASDDLCDQHRGRVLGTGAEVDPQQEPTPHGQRGMHPFHLFGTQFGMRLIQLHPLHLQVLHALPVVRFRALGCHPLEAMDGLEIHRTNVGGPLIADAPSLTFHQPYDGVFRELAAGHQSALAFRELPATSRTAQPFDMLVRPGPRPMRDVAFAKTIEPGTLWIWARESGIALLRWRRQCHNGPPVARNGLKDTELAPVSPRYYSPGLPFFCVLPQAWTHTLTFHMTAPKVPSQLRKPNIYLKISLHFYIVYI